MSLKRRDFLHTAVALGAPALGAAAGNAVAADAAPKDKLRILILGGTGFIGPHQVRYALARGHKVTLFNRGRQPQDWPGEVEELHRRPQHRRPEGARRPRVGRLHRQPHDPAVLGARRGPRAEGQGAASTSSSRRSRSTPPTTSPRRRDRGAAAYEGADPMAETPRRSADDRSSTAR